MKKLVIASVALMIAAGIGASARAEDRSPQTKFFDDVYTHEGLLRVAHDVTEESSPAKRRLCSYLGMITDDFRRLKLHHTQIVDSTETHRLQVIYQQESFQTEKFCTPGKMRAGSLQSLRTALGKIESELTKLRNDFTKRVGLADKELFKAMDDQINEEIKGTVQVARSPEDSLRALASDRALAR